MRLAGTRIRCELPLASAEKDGGAGCSDGVQRRPERPARGRVEGISWSANHHRAGSTITLSRHTTSAPGDLLVATDCNQATVFQATAGTASPTIVHAAGGTPGNATANLGMEPPPFTRSRRGARIYRLAASTYYVDVNPAGQPALYRSRPAGASAAPAPEELVEGVEDFQVSYGVDLDRSGGRRSGLRRSHGDGDPYLTRRSGQLRRTRRHCPGELGSRRQRPHQPADAHRTRTTSSRMRRRYAYNGVTTSKRRPSSAQSVHARDQDEESMKTCAVPQCAARTRREPHDRSRLPGDHGDAGRHRCERHDARRNAWPAIRAIAIWRCKPPKPRCATPRCDSRMRRFELRAIAFVPTNGNDDAYLGGLLCGLLHRPCAVKYTPTDALPTRGPDAVAAQPQYVVERMPRDDPADLSRDRTRRGRHRRRPS